MSATDTAVPASTPPAQAAEPTQHDVAPPTLTEDQQKLVSNSEMFKKRLEEAKAEGERSLLRALGMKNQEEIKESILRLKQLEEEKLSEHEKLQNRIKELEPTATKAAALDRVENGVVYAARFIDNEKQIGTREPAHVLGAVRRYAENPAPVRVFQAGPMRQVDLSAESTF